MTNKVHVADGTPVEVPTASQIGSIATRCGSLVERFVSYRQFDLRKLLIAQIRKLQHRRQARG